MHANIFWRSYSYIAIHEILFLPKFPTIRKQRLHYVVNIVRRRHAYMVNIHEVMPALWFAPTYRPPQLGWVLEQVLYGHILARDYNVIRTIKFQYGTPLGRSPFPHISIMPRRQLTLYYLPSTSFSWRPLRYFETAGVRLYKEEIGSYNHR